MQRNHHQQRGGVAVDQTMLMLQDLMGYTGDLAVYLWVYDDI